MLKIAKTVLAFQPLHIPSCCKRQDVATPYCWSSPMVVMDVISTMRQFQAMLCGYELVWSICYDWATCICARGVI